MYWLYTGAYIKGIHKGGLAGGWDEHPEGKIPRGNISRSWASYQEQLMGRGTQEASGMWNDRRKKKIPMDGHPPRKGFDGGERRGEAQGCRVMGKMRFPTITTPQAPGSAGDTTRSSQRVLFPKGMGRGEAVEG